jgi:hypothetical protein
MKKILLITAVLALMSLDINAGSNHRSHWPDWFSWQQNNWHNDRGECNLPKVPDSGSTALMLGAGMLAIGIAKRKS